MIKSDNLLTNDSLVLAELNVISVVVDKVVDDGEYVKGPLASDPGILIDVEDVTLLGRLCEAKVVDTDETNLLLATMEELVVDD